MKKRYILPLVAVLAFTCVTAGCGKKEEVAADTASSVSSISLLNIKGEVATQIEALAQQYEKETGVKVNVIGVPTGADSQATLKGYYLSDQMPDIIACESSGFGNWEGLLVDMSDQSWVTKTDAAYIDPTYGTIGFPYTTEAIGLAYNADILNKCGVDPASITGPGAMRAAFEAVAAHKEELGLDGVVAYCAEPVNLGWSAGNHVFGTYIDSGLARDDTTYIDKIKETKAVDADRFMHFADMVSLFNQYSNPDLLIAGTYDDQVNGFASGKYAFITQGSWIGASLSSSEAYAAAGSFPVGMAPYAFEDGMDTILTSSPSWWGVVKEGNVEAAEAFLQWCSEDTGQKILVEEAGFVSPFTDCKYVAADPFASVLSSYLADGKTSNWHWMELPSGIGNSEGGLCYCFFRYANGETDATGFMNDVNETLAAWYAKL